MRPCIPGLCIRAIGSLLCVPKYIVVCSSPSKCEFRGFRTYAALLNNKKKTDVFGLIMSIFFGILACLFEGVLGSIWLRFSKGCPGLFVIWSKLASKSCKKQTKSDQGCPRAGQHRSKGVPPRGSCVFQMLLGTAGLCKRD